MLLAGTWTDARTVLPPSPTSTRRVWASVVLLTMAATRLPPEPSSSVTMRALRTFSGPDSGTLTPSEAE